MLRSTRQVSETHESGVYLNRMIHQWYPAQYGGQIPDQMLKAVARSPSYKVWREISEFQAHQKLTVS